MAEHDFGIIDFFEENKWYSDYEPEKYNCISVDDDLLEELIIKYNKELMEMKTYFQVTTQPGNGLDYCGVTLIPPESLKQFSEELLFSLVKKTKNDDWDALFNETENEEDPTPWITLISNLAQYIKEKPLTKEEKDNEFYGLTNFSILFLDKVKEINKIYRMKQTSTPEEAVLSSERNKARNRIISAINEKFFQGVMSPSWYTDIDAWFDRYAFEEDVMFALFQHCYDHNGLAKQYIAKVADSWHSKGIKNAFDLDRYFMEYEKLKGIRLKIVKKLKRQGLLTEYEEEFIQKWVFEYNYGFDIIELALRKTTATSNPNFNYINTIITEWHKNGLKSKDEITAYEKSKKQSTSKKKGTESAIPQQGNFEQRKYDDDFYDSLYKNVRE